MKKLLFILCVLIVSINSIGQDVVGSRVIAKQALFVNGIWIDSIRVDTVNIQNDNRTLMTAGAIYKFVLGRIPAGAGLGTITSISQAYGIINTPNPITTTGSVRFDSATVFPQLRATIPANRFGIAGEYDENPSAFGFMQFNQRGGYFQYDSIQTTMFGTTGGSEFEVSDDFIDIYTQDNAGVNRLRTFNNTSSSQWQVYMQKASQAAQDNNLPWIHMERSDSSINLASKKLTFTTRNSSLLFRGDSVLLQPFLGTINIDSIRDGSTFNVNKIVGWRDNNGVVGYITPSYGISLSSGLLKADTSALATQYDLTQISISSLIGLTNNTVYYVNNSGALVALALGASGTILTSNGATSAPTFTAPAGGGLTVGTTTITSGTDKYALYNNAGVLGNYAGLQVANTNNDVLITAGAATSVPLNIKAAGSQSANLQNWSSSSGTGDLANISASGKLTSTYADLTNLTWNGTILQLGNTTPASTATPVTINSGATYADAVAGSKAKWKMWDNGVSADVYGLGISAAQFNFFTSSAASYIFYFGEVQKAAIDFNGNLRIEKAFYVPEQSAPSTPPSGYAVTYPKSDGLWYGKSDAGVETKLSNDAGTQGADVASVAGAITLGADGNSFEITGTNAITLISNTIWQNGSVVTLLFTSTASLTDGTANSGTNIGMELAGNTNFTGSAGATVTLRLMELGGTQRWYEIARSVQ